MTEHVLAPHERAWLERLKLSFSDPSLFAEALSHSTWVHETQTAQNSYERLEFLGDAVLQLLVSETLFALHLGAKEGELSRRRAQLVREDTLVRIAHTLGLGDVMRLGQGQRQGPVPDSVLADGVEALLGALYLDRGYALARRFFEPLLLPHLTLSHAQADAKTRLQELCHRRRLPAPRYALVEVGGPSHSREYLIELFLGDTSMGRATGSSKKAAQMRCAKAALAHFEGT